MKVLQVIATTFIKPFLTWYLKKPRRFQYKKIELIILPTIFHPQFFFSSKFLAEFIEGIDLKNKLFCEPCAGSGFISIVAHQQGANVVCFDVNKKAIENIQLNVNKNNIVKQANLFHIIESDGFSNIPTQTFDVIAINPPYFFKKVEYESQLPWYCGINGEFFTSFFSSLPKYLAANGKCFMILADNCDIKRIKAIAQSNQLNWHLIKTKKVWWENNFIFEITKASPD
jgi:release factor glutamine methyltransferase